MNPVTVNSNVVFIFRNNILDDFNIQKVEDKMSIVLGEDAQTSSATIPQQLKVVTSQSKNIQVAAQGNSLIITDLNFNETNVANVDFLRMADGAQKLFNGDEISRFGFNYQLTFKPDDFDVLKNKINEKFYKSEILAANTTLVFAFPNICYQKGDNKYTITFGAELNDRNVPVKLRVTANYLINPERSNPGDVEAFIQEFNDAYREVYEFVKAQL